MRKTLGILFASGWTLNDVMHLNWEQIGLCAGAVMEHKLEMVNMIAEALFSSSGKDKRPHYSVRSDGTNASDAKAKDRAHMNQMVAAGLPIHSR